MTTTLLQLVELDDPIHAALHIAKLFNPDMDVDYYRTELAARVNESRNRVTACENTLRNFKQFLQSFYTEQLFTPGNSENVASRLCLIDQVLDFRSGISVSLAIIVSHIATRLGFDVKGINFPGHFLLSLELAHQRRYFIDPLTGHFLTYQQLESLYTVLTDEEEMEAEQLEFSSTRSTVIRLLNNLKVAFMDEQKYAQALHCVDMLIELCPDDPYERRDRGFLLHQLQCFQVALADYKYFIRQCPKDPAAQLLKLQLRHIEPIPVVLH
ncbi:SirB1 family protein [Neptunicella sp. SCSIO 80796]|uniref:SirB1 family protein n=1 Tax=Neptunicella plasticusilytica TaxID=3117012 RepID=UPI003A4D558B